MSLSYALVQPQHLDKVWPKMAPWITNAMGVGATSEDVQRIKEDIARGTSQLWGVTTEMGEILVVVVTEAAMICGRRTLIIRHLGGRDMDKWFHALSIIEKWAMNSGFEFVEVWGRPGWIKVLGPLGYKHSFHVLTKGVDKEIH